MSFDFLSPVSSAHVLSGAIAVLVVLLWKQRQRSGQSVPYPPGPRPLPIVGNLFSMPQSKFVLTWSKFGEEYGPLTWLTVPGQTTLVLNSFEAVKELLEKRPLVFIDRPRFTMLKEILGMSDYVAVSNYNDAWKTQRAHLKQPLSASMVRSDYSSLLEAKAREYLERCVVRPEDFIPEINKIVAETIIKLVYGRLEDEQGRDYIQINTYVTDIILRGFQGYVVDLFPALQHLPAWLPRMKFKREAARWKREINELEHTVLESAKASTLSDDPAVRGSFMFKKLQELFTKHEEGKNPQQQTDDETMLARSGLTFFTQTTIESFVHAMTLFPSIQSKAQDEIDRVIASGRFPTFNDHPDLPYLHAVVLETMRWNPVFSSGIPHVSRQDDTYSGYFIPKGTGIMVNVWGLSRNSEYYPNPSVFDPERHLKQPPELDPREYFFGFGRRICPGRDLAFQFVWTMAASILWAFRLVGEEEDRRSLSEDLSRFTFETLSRPLPFKCQFVPRREGLKDKLGLSTT